MSDLIETPQVFDSKECLALAAESKTQKIKTRTAQVGDNITIRRALPHRDRKTIGAWCFLDHFGPLDLRNSKGLRVGPHPHMGLQTFTYPLAGEILHRDSLGSKQKIQPGEVNLMTAGRGISHSEESLPDGMLHGVQLWIALPNAARHREPHFIHYENLPSMQIPHLQAKLLVGEFNKVVSPVQVYSPLLGLDLNAVENTTCVLPLNPQFEHGVLPLIGTVEIANQVVDLDTLLYLPCGQSKLPLRMPKGSRVLIIGGEPFNEDILIWWNFVARTKDEMIQAAHAWNSHAAFGEVEGYQGDRLMPPALP
ncbi:MAG TPA: pirin family protein [Gammaproteobacteria bacterium]|nr:pirin family protein [Gammaproteobacteria bacterium]